MRRAPAAGEIDLLLSFREPSLLFIGGAVVAPWAAHAFSIEIRFTVGGPDRIATRTAERGVADLESVPDGHPFVEDEALAGPEAFFLRDAFEVLENPAFQVIDLSDPGLLEQGGGFFATNTTGAEHGDPRLSLRVDSIVEPLRELAE